MSTDEKVPLFVSEQLVVGHRGLLLYFCELYNTGLSYTVSGLIFALKGDKCHTYYITY